MAKEKTGTREWATSNLNIARGCPNGCLYCYARQMAMRFDLVASNDDWLDTKVDPVRAGKSYGKRKGNIMFPTTHDITPAILQDCLRVLRQILKAGNSVLIVSKPHPECIASIVNDATSIEHKGRVLFRFTIGAYDDDILSYWEPYAPSFDERLQSLKMAFASDWATSISIEPMLDSANVIELVERLDSYVTDKIWLGKMNNVAGRCFLADESHIKAIEDGQTDDRILSIVEALKDHPKIEWKDSVKKVIAEHGV